MLVVDGIGHACLADIRDPRLREAAAALLEDFGEVAHLAAPISQALAALAEFAGESVDLLYPGLSELEALLAMTSDDPSTARANGGEATPGGPSNRA